jgi:non-ribosomal peptide synthetase component F
MVQLPQDRPRPSKPTFVSGVVHSTLSQGLISKLESVARLLRVNMQAVLLAGLQAVLLRYTGQDDLVIGVPVAGRDRQETHGLVGYFINTLPVRCVAVEDASFADMVREASAATLAALDHSLLPLEEVVAASGVARVPNANPLFQVAFQYMPDGGGAGESRLGGLDVKPFEALGELAHAKMDLSLTLGGGHISADFMAEMFDVVTIQRLLNSFVTVLEQLVDSSVSPALAGNLLGPRDALEAARFSMGDERPAYLSAPLVHDAFEKCAAASPASRCLCYEGEWLNYGEVSQRVSALAERLTSLGVSPGVVVGVMLDRSFELIISILAVFKAGGVYLPCDPSYPDDRLEVYLEDASAVVVLTITEYAARARAMAPSGVSVVDLSAIDSKASGKASATMRSPGPEDPAYIIFTSGSTGRPKGVMIPHRAIVNHLLETSEFFSVNPDDASILTITINFDPHVTQALTPLVVGAGLVIAKPGGHADGDYLTGLISQQRVTHFSSTPSLALVQLQGKYAKECTALRVVMFGGEQLPREVITLVNDKVSLPISAIIFTILIF